jgi:hypothetical protein
VPCAYEYIVLLYLSDCVYNFKFGLVIQSTNSDQWTVGDAVIVVHDFGTICMISARFTRT